jgi:hypothetical protein
MERDFKNVKKKMIKTRNLSFQFKYFRRVTCRLVKDDRLALRLHLFALLVAAVFTFLSFGWDLISDALHFSSFYEELFPLLFIVFFLLLFIDKSIFPLLYRHFLSLIGLEKIAPKRTQKEDILANHIRPDVNSATPVFIVYLIAIFGAIVFFAARLESNLIQRLMPASKIEEFEKTKK